MICANYKKKEMMIKVLVEKMTEKTAWEAARANELLKLKCIFKYLGWEDLDWIHLAKVGPSDRAFVNMVMNVWILQSVRIL